MSGSGVSPLELLEKVCPVGAESYRSHRQAIMTNPKLAALSLRDKLLVGIGVAASHQSSRCTLMWAKQAIQAGVSPQEIVEAILVARLMKSATVNDAASETLEWLVSAGGNRPGSPA